jgi:hypothetical protein
VEHYKKNRDYILENRVLRRIFEPKWDDVIESWRKLYNVELHNLCSPHSIIRMSMSWRMRWPGPELHRGRRGKCIGC